MCKHMHGYVLVRDVFTCQYVTCLRVVFLNIRVYPLNNCDTVKHASLTRRIRIHTSSMSNANSHVQHIQYVQRHI
jgi:hypothetical protein